jgi:hypothetical protein
VIPSNTTFTDGLRRSGTGAPASVKADVFTHQREVEVMHLPRTLLRVLFREVCNRPTLASLRAWRVGRLFVRVSESRMRAPARFLCLTDDIEFQIALRELHYPPIRQVQQTTAGRCAPFGVHEP